MGVVDCSTAARIARNVNDLASALILAQPLERGVAQDVIGGPAGEFDLGDELWPDPVDTFAWSLLGQNDGGHPDDESVEPSAQINELLALKPVPTRPAYCSVFDGS